MARLPRLSPVHVPIHVIQRGNNRQVCFVAEEDYGAYLGWLAQYAKKYRGGSACLGANVQSCSLL